MKGGLGNRRIHLIIGGGPAGLSSAIYGGRAKLKTLVINKGVIGCFFNSLLFNPLIHF